MAKQLHPVVQELVDMIDQKGWRPKFEEAVKKAISYNVYGFENIKGLDDYIDWCDAQLSWVPVETLYGKEVYKHVCMFYFVLDQSPVKELQNQVVPHDKMQPLTPLSAWMRKFVTELGVWMDQPGSLTPERIYPAERRMEELQPAVCPPHKTGLSSHSRSRRRQYNRVARRLHV